DRRRRGAATARVGLRALPAEREARDRRGRKRSVPRDRDRRTRTRPPRFHRRRSREAPRCECRGGHDGWWGRVRLAPAPRADRVPRGLASRVAVAAAKRSADAGEGPAAVVVTEW